MKDFEPYGHIRLYENDWDYSSGMEMEVKQGEVCVYWRDHVIHEPNTYWRVVKNIDLELLLKTLNITENEFIQEMQLRFAFYDGIDKLRAFLEAYGVKYDYIEYDSRLPKTNMPSEYV